ncbi:hypothetical protein PAHAL_5G385600 [Panicum hallii]|uniref:Uncharacterized protein n=1 Tax=Panicum hallii TaxID=206008 RepID=A0A2T8IMJ9_9POAL|nr:hypothetical protein PAHAL_5G385600 [Panicum hallii]
MLSSDCCAAAAPLRLLRRPLGTPRPPPRCRSASRGPVRSAPPSWPPLSRRRASSAPPPSPRAAAPALGTPLPSTGSPSRPPKSDDLYAPPARSCSPSWRMSLLTRALEWGLRKTRRGEAGCQQPQRQPAVVLACLLQRQWRES